MAFPPHPRRVAVLGVGAMGRRHVRVWSELGDACRVSGVFDRDPAVALAVGREYGVPTFDDVSACIASSDLVVVASPIEAHAAGAFSALEQARDVLVEKPLCASVSEAFQLVRCAARNSSRLFVGHSERFNPVIVALRRVVRPREVQSISIRRAAPGSAREHDVLLSLGVHDVDLVAYLTRSSVSLRDVSALPSGDDEDRAALTLVASTGAVTRIVLDRAAPSRERTIELVTRQHVFEGDLLSPSLVRRPRRGGGHCDVELARVEPLVLQARAVAQALAGPPAAGSLLGGTSGESPLAANGVSVATGADGARALALALEARRRLRGGWTPERPVSEAS